MSYAGIVKNLIDEKMKSLHVAYLAKVISVSNGRAKIQPLGLITQNGSQQSQSVLTNVPITQAAQYKISRDEDGFAKLTPLSAGDIVICLCCDRYIGDALKGNNTLLPAGWHSKSDSVIVGII